MSMAVDTGGAGPLALRWRRLKRHRLALVSLAFLAVLVVLSFGAPIIADLRGVDPATTDLFRRHEAPSGEHWKWRRTSPPFAL